MVPHDFLGFNVEEYWCFLVEKPGLNIAQLNGGLNEDLE